MGIKNINPMLKKDAPDAFFSLDIKELKGKRIAIDGNNWMFINMSTARKRVINRTDIAAEEINQAEVVREWIGLCLNFLTHWMHNGITPIIVFDGKHPPEKDSTKQKRKDVKVKAQDKIALLYQQLQGDILNRPANVVEELRKELRNYTTIPSADFETFKMVMIGIGIPVIEAEGDGERLCSSLCIEGKVAAVYSTDTDNLVYGCPLIVTGNSEDTKYDDNGWRLDLLKCARLDKVLEALKINHVLFLDLCIMSGCDYNTNIPGYGVVKSLALLRKYKGIDFLPSELDIGVLKHKRCRELFSYRRSEDLAASPIVLCVNRDALQNAREYLDMVGNSGKIANIMTAYDSVESCEDGTVESLRLVPVTPYVPPKVIIIRRNVENTVIPAKSLTEVCAAVSDILK